MLLTQEDAVKIHSLVMARRLSIIIPAFNEELLLPDTLESVRRSLETLELVSLPRYRNWWAVGIGFR